MKQILQFISLAALCFTVFPAVLFYADRVELDAVKTVMLWATVVWFVVTPLWMGRSGKKA